MPLEHSDDFAERTTDPGGSVLPEPDAFDDDESTEIVEAPLTEPEPAEQPGMSTMEKIQLMIFSQGNPLIKIEKCDPQPHSYQELAEWELRQFRKEALRVLMVLGLFSSAIAYVILPTQCSSGRPHLRQAWEKVDHSLRIKFDRKEADWRDEGLKFASGQMPIEDMSLPAFLRNWEWLGCGVDENVILKGVNELDAEVTYLNGLEGTKKDQAELMLHNDDFEAYKQIDEQNSLFYLVSNSQFVWRMGGSCQARAKKVAYIWTSLYPEDAEHMYLDSRVWVDEEGKATAHIAVYIDAAAFEEIEPGRKWYVMDGEHLKSTSVNPSNPKPIKQAFLSMAIGTDAQPEYFCGLHNQYRMSAPPKNGVQRDIFDDEVIWSNVVALSEAPPDADKVLPNMKAELYACYELTYQLTRTSKPDWLAYAESQEAELQLLSDNRRKGVSAEDLYDNLIAGRDVRCGIKAALPLHHTVLGKCSYYDEMGEPEIVKQFQCEMGYTQEPFEAHFHWGGRQDCGGETTSIVKTFTFQETTSASRQKFR